MGRNSRLKYFFKWMVLLFNQLGFDSLHFARIDYQDRAKRKVDKSLEVIWRGSKTFGSSSQIFTNAFPTHYSPPGGFNFEVSGDFEPVQVLSLMTKWTYLCSKDFAFLVLKRFHISWWQNHRTTLFSLTIMFRSELTILLMLHWLK